MRTPFVVRHPIIQFLCCECGQTFEVIEIDPRPGEVPTAVCPHCDTEYTKTSSVSLHGWEESPKNQLSSTPKTGNIESEINEQRKQ